MCMTIQVWPVTAFLTSYILVDIGGAYVYMYNVYISLTLKNRLVEPTGKWYTTRSSPFWCKTHAFALSPPPLCVLYPLSSSNWPQYLLLCVYNTHSSQKTKNLNLYIFKGVQKRGGWLPPNWRFQGGIVPPAHLNPPLHPPAAQNFNPAKQFFY